MIKDLNDIYDEGLDQVGPPPFSEDSWGKVQKDRSYMGGTTSFRNAQEYTGYLPHGLSEAPGRNPELERGAAQSNWDKVGNGLAHTLVKSGTQLIDMAGGLQSLLFEWGDDRDYKNGFTQVADEINGWMDKHAPMYRSTEGTFGLGDLSWWMQNGSGLVSSMAGFAVGGAGIAKGLGALGKLTKIGAGVEWMAGVATQDAEMAELIANMATETTAAGTLAFSEGAMSGRRVFDEVYSTQLKLGATEQDARHIAAESAATTVQLNTFVNTGFNMLGGMGAFFDHSKDNVLRVAKQNLKKEVGETAEEFATRLRSVRASDFAEQLGTVRTWDNVGKKLAKKGRESVAEGMEELTNQWAEKVGIEQGKKGEVKGFIDQLSAISDYADYTMNAEGGLNFMMGMIGGPLQHGAVNYLPIHKVLDKTTTNEQGAVIGEDGLPVEDVTRDGAKTYKRMSAHSLANNHISSRFDYLKNQLVEDVEWFARTQTALKTAQANGQVIEAERLKNELLNASLIQSVNNGMGSNLAEMYKDIAGISNDITPKEEIIQKANTLVASIADKQSKGIDVAEDQAQLQQLQEQLKVASDKTAAQVLGVSTGKDDNAYIEKANKVVERLAKMDEIRDAVFEKFGFATDSPNPAERGIADFITDLGIRAYLTSERVKEMKAELAGLDNDILANYSTILDEAALAEKEYRGYVQADNRLSRRVEKINSLIDALKSAEGSSDPAVLTEATDKLAQYGLTRMEHESNKEFSKRVQEKLGKVKDKIDADIVEHKEKILTTEGYEKWATKNPGKHFGNYIDHLRSTSGENAYVKHLADSIADTELANELITESFKSLSNTATLSKVLKNGDNYFKKLESLKKSLQESRSKEIKAGLANESNIRKDNRVKLEKLLNKSKEQIAKLNEELENAEKLLADIEVLENKEDTSIVEKGKMSMAKQMVLENITRINLLINKEIQQAKKIKDWMEDAVYVPPPPPPPPSSNPAQQQEEATPFEEVFNDLTAVIEEYKREGSLTPEMEAELNRVRDAYSFKFSEYKKAFEYVESLLTPETVDAVNDLAEKLKADSTADPSLNYFGHLVSAEESAKLVVATKEWIKLDDQLDELVEQVKIATEKAKLESELLGASSSILETNFEDFSPDLSATSVVQVDRNGEVLTAKQLEPAASGASKNTIFFWVKKKSGDIETVSTNRLEEGTALEVLSGTDLLPGTEVTFELDLDFDMPTSSYVAATTKAGPEKKQATRTSDMLNEDGTIKTEFMDRLPIKIVYNGKTVQWMHTPDWIKQEDGDLTGPERFYHTVDEKIDPRTGEVIIPPGNAQREAMANLSLRSAFVQAYNEGIKAGKPQGWLKVGSKVTKKTEGNFVYAGNGTVRANVLKEHRLVAGQHMSVPVALGIFQNGTLLGTQARPEITSDITVPEAYNNRVLAMLPMADGKYVPVPLSGHKLSDNMKGEKDETTDAWQTFNRVVELFLGKQGTEAERTLLSTELGYDISTRDGFRQFITQYFTHFSQEGDTSPGVKIKTVKNLQTGKVDVHIETYTDEANRVVVLELDPEGNLTRESKAEVAHLFSNRYRAISLTKPQHGIKGLNHQGEFKEPLFVKGKWTVKSHPSYNDYITRYLISPVAYVDFTDGGVERTDSSGTKYKDFFYGVNPIVTYDTTPFNNLQTPLNAAIAVGTVQPKPSGSVLSQMFDTDQNPALRDIESTTNALKALPKNAMENSDIPLTPLEIDGYKRKPSEQYSRKDPQSVAEAYHKAKADDSNPELVKAVESLLSKEQTTPTTQSETEAKKADIERRKQALRDIMEATGEWMFINGVTDGTFMGDGLLNMNENGDVVLTRFTDSQENLTKGKGVTENLANIAGQFGGEQVATSGIEGGLQAFSNGVVGEYHIPLSELIQLIKDGYIVFAGLGNKEFVLSPHIADKYLTKINGKLINAKYDAELKALEEQTTTQSESNPALSDVESIENRNKQTEAKIKNKGLFLAEYDENGNKIGDSVGEIISQSDIAPIATSVREQNGFEFVEFSNPQTGEVDVIVTGDTKGNYVGFYRLYENGKPTNKWSSKMNSKDKNAFKTMMSGVQEMLPQGHEYSEKTSISTDGLRVWNQQLQRGYELQYDNNGKLITDTVAINGDALINELDINVNQGNFDNIRVSNKEDFNKVKKALLPYLEKFGLNQSNINWVNGTVEIDLPVLKKSESLLSKEQPIPQADNSVISEMFADELPSTPISILTVGITEGMQTNLANLEKLFNFTPESERNGKSTFEVYEKLKALNVTHIVPGYNPFKKC